MASKSKKEEKVLSSEEANACMDRLYSRAIEDMKRKEERRKATLANPPGRLPPKKLATSQLENLTQRMYDKQLEHKKLKEQQAEQKKEKEVAITKKSLTDEELAESVQRMYNQQRDIKMRNMQKLQQTYHPPPEKKTLTKGQIEAMGNRLSKEWKEQKEAAKRKVWERDYAAMEPKKTTITPEELKEMADRLHVKKS